MFDSPTLSVSELAERWGKTPRQILDYAQELGVPLYFMFDGLAFDLADRWHRFNGDADQCRELGCLQANIKAREGWIRRSVRNENGEWEQRLTAEEIRSYRAEIEADKVRCERLEEMLEQREIGRNRMHYRGLMRAGPKMLFDIAQSGQTNYLHLAFHPATPVRVLRLPDRNEQVWDGRVMALEVLGAPCPALTIESLCAVTAEVKAIEERLKAKQAATAQDEAPAETPERRRARLLAELEAESAMSERGALQRLAARYGVDRSNMGKAIKKARAEREANRRAGQFGAQLVRAGKRIA